MRKNRFLIFLVLFFIFIFSEKKVYFWFFDKNIFLPLESICAIFLRKTEFYIFWVKNWFVAYMIDFYFNYSRKSELLIYWRKIDIWPHGFNIFNFWSKIKHSAFFIKIQRFYYCIILKKFFEISELNVTFLRDI